MRQLLLLVSLVIQIRPRLWQVMLSVSLIHWCALEIVSGPKVCCLELTLIQSDSTRLITFPLATMGTLSSNFHLLFIMAIIQRPSCFVEWIEGTMDMLGLAQLQPIFRMILRKYPPVTLLNLFITSGCSNLAIDAATSMWQQSTTSCVLSCNAQHIPNSWRGGKLEMGRRRRNWSWGVLRGTPLKQETQKRCMRPFWRCLALTSAALGLPT